MNDDVDQIPHVQGLFLQQIPALRGFVLSLLGDFSVVDDVVQETFLMVTQKAGDFERGTNFRAWVWKIARFKSLQMRDKLSATRRMLSVEAVEALCAHEISEEGFVEAALRHLEPCLEGLGAKARLAVGLRYQQAHRPPEIARHMGWTTEAVHVALARARVALRDCVTRRMAAENA